VRVLDFLDVIYRGPFDVPQPVGHFNLSYNRDDTWKEEWYRWPKDRERIGKRIDVLIEEGYGIHYSPYLFKKADSHKDNVICHVTIASDLDQQLPDDAPFSPSIVVETSPGRTHGYWFLEEPLTSSREHENYSKRITYSMPRADRAGWSIGKRFRLPGSINYKYKAEPVVTVTKDSRLIYTQRDLQLVPDIVETDDADEPSREELVDAIAGGLALPKGETYRTHRSSLPRAVREMYRKKPEDIEDRSRTLWALMCALARTSATFEEAYSIAYHAPSNKYLIDQRYNGDIDLAQDLMRAYRANDTEAETADIKARIDKLRTSKEPRNVIHLNIATIVYDFMDARGRFIHTQDGDAWYINEVSGHPMTLEDRSSSLNAYLENNFALNPVEREQRYTSWNLRSRTLGRIQNGVTARTSYFHQQSRTLYVYTGHRNIIMVTPEGITSNHINGTDNVVFPYDSSIEPLSLGVPDERWYDTLFDGCFDNLTQTDVTSAEAKALASVLTSFILLRDIASTRPILALFGEPGSGKSTLLKRINVLLYGPRRALNSVTTAENFDHACSTQAFVVFDGIDSTYHWLPDRLSLSSSPTDVQKRALYTNNETYTMRKNALVAVTAHNPRFGREDIVDRFVMLQFGRIDEFLPESDILLNVSKNRERIWSGVLQSLRRTLASDMPTQEESPQFRIQDFARVGLWIAKGISDEMACAFHSVLVKMERERARMLLQNEDTLIEALNVWCDYQTRRNGTAPGFELSTRIHTVISEYANMNVQRPFLKRYPNARLLDIRLTLMKRALSAVFAIESLFDAATGRTMWQIQKV